MGALPPHSKNVIKNQIFNKKNFVQCSLVGDDQCWNTERLLFYFFNITIINSGGCI